MTQFATADDFVVRFGITLSDDEMIRVDGLLELASGVIQNTVGQQIERSSSTLERPSTASDRIRLPERPVNSVDAVRLTDPSGNETTVSPNSYYVDGDELVRISYRVLSPELTFGFGQRGWISPAWTISIDYDHGFDEIPQTVKSACLEMCVRVWVNPGSVAQEKEGDTSTLYYYAPSRPTGVLLTDTEEKALNKLLRRQSGSTILR